MLNAEKRSRRRVLILFVSLAISIAATGFYGAPLANAAGVGVKKCPTTTLVVPDDAKMQSAVMKKLSSFTLSHLQAFEANLNTAMKNAGCTTTDTAAPSVFAAAMKKTFTVAEQKAFLAAMVSSGAKPYSDAVGKILFPTKAPGVPTTVAPKKPAPVPTPSSGGSVFDGIASAICGVVPDLCSALAPLFG